MAIQVPIKFIGKRKSRSQMCEVFTDDGQIKQVEGDVLISCVDFPDKSIGFLLDADDQFLSKSDKHWYQILYEKSSLPVCMIAEQEETEDQLTKILNQIFDESQQAAKEKQYSLAKKNQFIEKITLIAGMGFATAIVFFAISYFGGHR